VQKKEVKDKQRKRGTKNKQEAGKKEARGGRINK